MARRGALAVLNKKIKACILIVVIWTRGYPPVDPEALLAIIFFSLRNMDDANTAPQCSDWKSQNVGILKKTPPQALQSRCKADFAHLQKRGFAHNRFWLRMHQHHGQHFCGYIQHLYKNIHAHTHLILCVQRHFHSQFFSKVVCTSDKREWALQKNAVTTENSAVLAIGHTRLIECIYILKRWYW